MYTRKSASAASYANAHAYAIQAVLYNIFSQTIAYKRRQQFQTPDKNFNQLIHNRTYSACITCSPYVKRITTLNTSTQSFPHSGPRCNEPHKQFIITQRCVVSLTQNTTHSFTAVQSCCPRDQGLGLECARVLFVKVLVLTRAFLKKSWS